jgi:polysaccharide deacetylase family sporulation protein PdaB
LITVVVPGRVARTARRCLALAGATLAAVVLTHLAAPPPAAQGRAVTSPSTAPLVAADLTLPLRSVDVRAPDIALTFDISWGTVMPPKVIAILRREHVAATFFLSGPWVAAHPEIVRQIAAVPYFEVESHGQAHVNLGRLGAAAVEANIEKANAAIYAVTGRRPTMIRPPNGDYSRTSLAATAALGMRTVIWDTDSLDWMNPGVDTIIRRVVTRAHPGDIVLLHASDTCKETNLALPDIIRDLRTKGYRFVTVGRLLKEGTALAHRLD